MHFATDKTSSPWNSRSISVPQLFIIGSLPTSMISELAHDSINVPLAELLTSIDGLGTDSSLLDWTSR